jgi:DNA-binding NarL/FixJ family response regulator
MIRVLIADDHQLVREGLGRILASQTGMEILGEAASGEELLELLEENRPDVVLLDISMPGMDFMEIMRRIQNRHPDLPVLIVSMHAEKLWAVQAFRAGAAGYLTKNHSAAELVEGIRRLHRGSRYLTPELADAFAREISGEDRASPAEVLSRREFEVLRKLGSGKMVKTVAREMAVSPKTVSTYRSRILRKLGLGSTSDLIRFVLEHDLLD